MESGMIFRYTIMYVVNVETTLTFYEQAFGLTRGMLHEAGDYGELITGETKLAFSSVELMRQLGKVNRPGIAGGQFRQIMLPLVCRPAWRSSVLRPRQAGYCRWAQAIGGC